MKHIKFRIFLLLLVSLTLLSASYAQTPAFPGVEGWGRFATGGRGGDVYIVTNLNNSGEGSLRSAVSQSNRIVVFAVSGTIHLTSELKIQGNITIAGQTAPGDGICVADYPTKIVGSNVIVRFIRFRLGDRYDLSSSDSFGVNDLNRIVLDHCSMTWGVDECFSAYGNNAMTVQYCIIGEGLNYRGHSMGGLWGGGTSYHHNLITSNRTRHPKYAYTYDEDITDSRNNVIYNWMENSAYTSPTGRVNLVNNYYKPGPSTKESVIHRIVQAEPTKRMYITGNVVEGYPEITENNWNGGVDPLNGGLPIKYTTPFTVGYTIPDQNAYSAYEEVLAHAGASLPARDAVDARLVKNVLDGSGTIIDRQSEVGGYPVLEPLTPPVDTDSDGIPDNWEDANGLDKNDPADRNGDKFGEGYTNIEYYVNSLVEFPVFLFMPDSLKAKTLSDVSIELRWKDNTWHEESYVIERSENGVDYTVLATTDADIISYVDVTAEPSTHYYYRVKALNDTVSTEYIHASATTFDKEALPGKATAPLPPDGILYAGTKSSVLSWIPGDNSLTYSIRIGNSEQGQPVFQSGMEDNRLVLGDLLEDTVYYWRVDAENSYGTTAGDLWKFHTRSLEEECLVAYWKMNQKDESILVEDYSGLINHGIIEDMVPSWVDARFGNGFDFEGNSNGKIAIACSMPLDFRDQSFTISFWMKSDILHSGCILQKGRKGDDKKCGYSVELNGQNIAFTVSDTGKVSVLESGNSVFHSGVWTHIILVRNRLGDRLQFYQDSVLVLESDDQTADIGGHGSLILGNSSTLDAPFLGILDDIRIYNYALSRDEVSALYNFDPTGIEESKIPLASLYPNPASGKVTIGFKNKLVEPVKIEMFDVNGKVVDLIMEDACLSVKNELIWDPSARGLEAGSYFIVISTGEGREVLKLNYLPVD